MVWPAKTVYVTLHFQDLVSGLWQWQLCSQSMSPCADEWFVITVAAPHPAGWCWQQQVQCRVPPADSALQLEAALASAASARVLAFRACQSACSVVFSHKTLTEVFILK